MQDFTNEMIAYRGRIISNACQMTFFFHSARFRIMIEFLNYNCMQHMTRIPHSYTCIYLFIFRLNTNITLFLQLIQYIIEIFTNSTVMNFVKLYIFVICVSSKIHKKFRFGVNLSY